MRYVNLVLNALCDLLFLPFRGESPWPAMVAVSFVTAVVFVGVFRGFSDQRALKRSKGRMLARALELLLFRHDMLVSLTAFPRIVAANGRYFLHLLKPMAVAIIPSILLLIQLSCWFEYRPFAAGEPGLLTVDFTEAFPLLSEDVALTTSEGLEIETAGLRIPALAQMNWRLRAIEPGTAWVEVSTKDTPLRKEVKVGDRIERISRSRVRAAFWNELMHPSEPPIPEASPVERIRVHFPQRKFWLAGVEIPWVVAFLVLTMLFGLIVGRVLRVSF